MSIKIFLILLFAIGGIAAVKRWRLPLWGLFCWYVVRLTFFWWYFSAVGYPFDIQGWLVHGNRVCAGEIPGLDFKSPYGFLFNLMIGGAVAIWNGPFSIIALFTLFELAAVLCLRVIVFDEGGCAVDRVSWLTIFNPILLMEGGFHGQDESIMLFFCVLGVFSLIRFPRVLPVVCVLGVLCTKVLAVLYFAPLFLFVSIRRTVHFIILIFSVFSVQLLVGINPFCLEFERAASADRIASFVTPGNPWYVVRQIFGISVEPMCTLCFLLLVGIVLYVAIGFRYDENKRLNAAEWTMIAIGVLIVSVNKMSYKCYFIPAIGALSLAMVRNHRFVIIYGCYFLWSIITLNVILARFFEPNIALLLHSFLMSIISFCFLLLLLCFARKSGASLPRSIVAVRKVMSEFCWKKRVPLKVSLQ